MRLTKCDRCGKEISKEGALSADDVLMRQLFLNNIFEGVEMCGYSHATIQTKGWASQFETRFDLCGECTSDFVDWLWKKEKTMRVRSDASQ